MRLTADTGRTDEGTHLQLPKGVSLYVATCLPEVFELRAPVRDDAGEQNWLYVPSSILATYSDERPAEAAGTHPQTILRQGIEINGHMLFPIVFVGGVSAALVTPSGTQDIASAVMESVVAHLERTTRSGGGVSTTPSRFLTTLFRSDDSFEVFTRRMLDTLSEQHPESLAALYADTNGVFIQRLVIGNLLLYDKLHSILDMATAFRWREVIENGSYLIPADLVPDQPVFCASPPNYLFVHPGPRSQHTSYIIAVAFPGNIDRPALDNVREIARLASMLRDTQFSASSELFSLFMRLSDILDANTGLSQMLQEVFHILESQMIVSRMALLTPDGICHSLTRRPHSEPRVRHEKNICVASSLRHRTGFTRPFIAPDVQDLGLTSDETKRYYLDDVRSEAVYPVRLGGRKGLLAFGCPVNGTYLSSMDSLLASVAKFLTLWSDLTTRHQEVSTAGGNRTDLSTARFRRRLQIMHKLAGGDSKDILGTLTEIRGHTNVVQDSLTNSESTLSPADLKSVVEKIATAVDSAASRIGQIRDICTLTEECFSGDVALATLVRELPVIVRGYVDQIRRVKKTDIRITGEPLTDTDVSWPWSVVFDSVLSPLLALIDSATASGTVEANITPHGDGAALIFRVDHQMIGSSDLVEALRLAFGEAASLAACDSLEGVIHTEDLLVSYSGGSDDRIEILVARI